RISPKLDRYLVWLVGGVLMVAAATRTGGIDYDQYLQMIENVRAVGSDDIVAQLLFAEDPVFLLVIHTAGVVSPKPIPGFSIVGVVSVGSKTIATSVAPRFRTLLISTYAVFLAPGLEFAAIRAGMAVGLVLIAFSLISKRSWIWMFLGILSHASTLVLAVG